MGMKQRKKSSTTKKQNRQDKTIIAAALYLTIGFIIGLAVQAVISSDHDPAPTYHAATSTASASPQEVESAKSQIAELYRGQIVSACQEVNDGEYPAAGRYELTYRNLRINKHADRAILTDCSNFDTLLAKNKAGQWVKTDVNLQIGNRLNPAWQKECGIEDITVADDQVRPENSSIDAANLAECKQLNQQ